MKGRIIVHVVTPVATTLALFVLALTFITLPAVERILMNGKRENIRNITAAAIHILKQYDHLVKIGDLSLIAAQTQAKETLRHMRWGPSGKDYVWINDMHPRMVMHPYRTDLEGKDVTNYPDGKGNLLFVNFVKTVKSKGTGYVEYVWQWQDDPTRILPKLSHVRGFKPWGWIVGTGIYVHDVEERLADIRNGIIAVFTVIFSVALILAAVVIRNSIRSETQRESARLALVQSEKMLEDIIAFLPDATFVVNADRKVIAWNLAMEKLTGISHEDIIGKGQSCYNKAFFDHAQPMLIDFVFTPDLDKQFSNNYVGFSREAGRVTGEIFAPRIGTGGRFLYGIACPLHDRNGVLRGAIESIRDITDRVQMQEALVQSEKMLSVGGLAAGMAHEINNPLAGIVLNAELAARRIGGRNNNPRTGHLLSPAEQEQLTRLTSKIKLQPLLDNILEAGRRAAKVVDNMLGFARKPSMKGQMGNLNQVAEDAISLASTEFNLRTGYDFKQIAIERQLTPDLPMVPFEQSKLIQVLLNILQNAAHAMKAARTKNPTITVRSVQPNDQQVQLSIEDNGPGMDETTRKRIFEPFFTTKAVGEGTGLGLSISYFIITQNHGGNLVVESTPGAGSKFVITLPIRS